MATAKKLPSGNFRVRVYVGVGANGKKKYKSFTATTKKRQKDSLLNMSQLMKIFCLLGALLTSISKAKRKYCLPLL